MLRVSLHAQCGLQRTASQRHMIDRLNLQMTTGWREIQGVVIGHHLTVARASSRNLHLKIAAFGA